MYRSVVTTSRFGIASADWTIPENTRLGDYRIWVGVDGGDDEAAQDVRIGRYELPNFKVNVDVDRKFYLPGHNATVTVRAAIEKLRTLALEQANTTYWALEANTPFHGWGLAGRIETTALVVQALSRNCNSQNGGCDVDRKLINRALLFLLKQKDHYGAWHSTQATVNVLDAMLLMFSNNVPRNAASSTDVVVNGSRAQTLQIDGRSNNPITVDISGFLKPGKNRIEIKHPGGVPFASV